MRRQSLLFHGYNLKRDIHLQTHFNSISRPMISWWWFFNLFFFARLQPNASCLVTSYGNVVRVLRCDWKVVFVALWCDMACRLLCSMFLCEHFELKFLLSVYCVWVASKMENVHTFPVAFLFIITDKLSVTLFQLLQLSQLTTKWKFNIVF